MLSHLFANININEDDKSAKKKPEIKDGLNLVPNPPSNRGWFSYSRGSEQPKKQKVHIPTDDLLPYAPWFVSQLRFLPETAAYILYQWLTKTKLDVDTNTLEKLKTVLAWRTSMGNGKPLKDFIGTSNKPKLQEPRNSYMVSKFASPPPFPSLNLIVINKILNEADLPSAKNTNSLAGLHHLAQQLELLCGVSEVKFRFHQISSLLRLRDIVEERDQMEKSPKSQFTHLLSLTKNEKQSFTNHFIISVNTIEHLNKQEDLEDVLPPSKIHLSPEPVQRLINLAF